MAGVGSNPDRFVMLKRVNSSAVVGWIPTVFNRVLIVMPALFGNEFNKRLSLLSFYLKLEVQTYFMAAPKPWIISPANGPT